MSATAQLRLFDEPARTISISTVASTARRLDGPTPAPLHRRSQAWLALHFANLALAAAYRTSSLDRRTTLDSSPWAVIDEDRLKHVVACNELAWKHGIRPGHRMNAAIALCGSLALVSRDMTAETQLMVEIADHCLKYTSAVSLQSPNEVLLEVRGSFRLFGGASALMERVQADFASFDAGLQLALAPTARSAQWLARGSSTPRVCLPRELGDGLGSLPIASLQWPLPIELKLTRFGVTTVGDLMRLSRKDLARRIGIEPVRELQQALGRTAWMHRGWSTPPCHQDRILLDFEIETTTLLEKFLERSMTRLKDMLIGCAREIDELTVTLKHREGSTPITLRLQQATSDATHLLLLLHEHLDRLELRAPVREILLKVPRLLVARPRTRSLAIDPGKHTDVLGTTELKGRLLEQLQSRFGPHAIRALAAYAHHVPERAQGTSVPNRESTTSAPRPQLPRRPLWLLREPKALSREYRRDAIQIESSPETLEAEAWAGPPVRRAYYRARTRAGIECWIYRDLNSPHHWFLHGLFG